MINEIYKKQLLNLLDDNETKTIDIRPVDAYNEWKLGNEARGSHIKGSKSLPKKWLKYIEWMDFVRSKSILPDDKIVIYGVVKDDAKVVAQRFINSEYTHVFIHYHFEKWAVNPDLLMVKLERYRHLVSAKWVNELISGWRP